MSSQEQALLLALVKLLFPREMLDYFEVVGYEETGEEVIVRLDERDRIHKRKPGHEYEKHSPPERHRVRRGRTSRSRGSAACRP